MTQVLEPEATEPDSAPPATSGDVAGAPTAPGATATQRSEGAEQEPDAARGSTSQPTAGPPEGGAARACAPARGGNRAARPLRGLGLQGSAFHRAPGGRADDPAAATPLRRRRGGRRAPDARRDRRARQRADRAPGQRRQHPHVRGREAASDRRPRAGRRLLAAAREVRPAARAEVQDRSRVRALADTSADDRLLPGLLPARRPRRAGRPRRRRRLALLHPRRRAIDAGAALQPAAGADGARPGRGGDRVARDRPRDGDALRGRGAGRDGSRHLRRLAGLLHGRHGRVPARPGRPAAHGPRRRLLQRHLRARRVRRLRGSPATSRC